MTDTRINPSRCDSSLAAEPRWKMWGCLLLLLTGLLVGIGPRINLAKWEVKRGFNSAFDEAIQWTHGAMALSDACPRWEAPLIAGKRYNVVGDAFLFISLLGLKLSEWSGAPPDTFFPPYYIALVALPIPLVAFGVFRGQTRSSAWGAVLAAYLIIGTSLRPILWHCQGSLIYYINHALAVVGLLLFAGDMLGRRRVWPSAIGLALACWSRQMTIFYVVALLILTWRSNSNASSASSESEISPAGRPLPIEVSRRTPFRFIAAVVTTFLLAAVPMTLNYLRLGDPLVSGYRGMYDGRTDQVAVDSRACFWGPRWFARHFVAMNLTMPTPDIRENTLYLVHHDREGGSIWLTTPILCAVFVTARQWWRDRARRILMLSTLPVIVGVMGYHTTGAQECGYYRYSLDFIPIWFAVIAPYVSTRKAAPWTLGCMAWSALYFHFLSQ